MECTHRAIRSWSQLDGSPVEMWSCVDCGWRFEPVRERQPLTDEEIENINRDLPLLHMQAEKGSVAVIFARAIERAHGIGREE